MTKLDFTCIADLRCGVMESPVYDERADILYFVDIPGRKLHAMPLSGGPSASWDFGSEVCSLGLAASGRLVVALAETVILFDTKSGEQTEIARIETDIAQTRLNDGKVGPDGAFWVGSMNKERDGRGIASLYRVTAGGSVERKVEDVQVANGLAWTADGELMFFADSRGAWIDRWRFDRASGAMSGRRRLATLADAAGRPDGGTCDVEGFYWSAGVSAGRLNRFAPDGDIVASYALPAPAPTMPCFGGRDFHTLFLTSLREGRPPEALAKAPQSGGLFSAPSPVAGFPAWRFLDT